jgi:hypothetical protein
MSFKSLLIFTKASHFQTKASTSLKMNLKRLKIFQNVPNECKNLYLTGNNTKTLEFFVKASIPLIMSSKSLVIFEKASDFLFKPPFL